MTCIKADNEAGNKAVDSLINYETVKYFNNEVKISYYPLVPYSLCLNFKFLIISFFTEFL